MEFKKLTKFPKKPIQIAIEQAVKQFIKDSRIEKVNEEGFYNQTLAVIVESINNPESRQFWLVIHDNKVLTYVLSHVSIDVDNSKCFWITQAWVSPEARGHKIIKIWRDKLYTEAKKLGCKHILVPSSRGEKAYCRFLGDGWHKYVTLLKKDL